jgi:NTE family protein
MEATFFTNDKQVRDLLSELRDCCPDKEFSDIVDGKGRQYVDLVMEGGGVLGIALVGYTYVLEEMGIRFLGVGGTSAGAINALLVASLATPAKPKSAKIVQLLANTNLREFVDGDPDVQDLIDAIYKGAGPFKLGLKGIQVLDNLRRDLGLNPGSKFLEWLSGALAEAGIRTTRQLAARMKSLPKSLRKRDGKALTVKEAAPQLALVAADVSTETKVDFPRMAPIYFRKSGSVNPALYVRASMSVPFFFHPLRIDNIPQGKTARKNWEALASYDGQLPTSCTLVDGGIMSNFPIDLFHDPKNVPIAPTFGAKLGTDERQTRTVASPMRLLGAVFNSARHTLDYDFIVRNPDYKRLVTAIDTGDHNWLNFEMAPKDQLDLFVRGARAAKEFLVEFDWSAYKEIRKQIASAHRVTAG